MNSPPASMLLLIGPLPKETATGVTMGFQSLIAGCEEQNIPHQVLDLQMAGEPTSHGVFSWNRLRQLLQPLWAAFKKIPGSRTVYLTIACSKAGFAKDFLIIWWSWLWRARIVLHLKSGGYGDFYQALAKWQQWVVRQTLQRATKIITLGHSIKHQFNFLSNSAEKVVVVFNGPPGDFENTPTHPKELQPNDPIKVLYLSNLIPSKGYLDVVEACRLLQQNPVHNFEFHFCGAFPTTSESTQPHLPVDSASFQTLLNTLPHPQQVHYHGTVRGTQKLEWLNRCHLFVLPTQYPTEGQPISIIEAMAYGLPVVTTRWRGIVEQVVEGETGTFVEFNNPQSLADGILRLIVDRNRYRTLSQAALERYRTHFTRSVHLRRMLDVLCPDPTR